jgi:transcriptional regulator with XRE-family HTH domain
LGRRIVKLRGKRRWSQQKLAQRLGVPRSRLAHWECGQCPPPLPDLLALGRCLEVSIEEMVLGDDTPTYE